MPCFLTLIRFASRPISLVSCLHLCTFKRSLSYFVRRSPLCRFGTFRVELIRSPYKKLILPTSSFWKSAVLLFLMLTSNFSVTLQNSYCSRVRSLHSYCSYSFAFFTCYLIAFYSSSSSNRFKCLIFSISGRILGIHLWFANSCWIDGFIPDQSWIILFKDKKKRSN